MHVYKTDVPMNLIRLTAALMKVGEDSGFSSMVSNLYLTHWSTHLNWWRLTVTTEVVALVSRKRNTKVTSSMLLNLQGHTLAKMSHKYICSNGYRGK